MSVTETTGRSVRVDVRGVVQGVGFRPYVYRLATSRGLRGSVRNTGGHVIIEASGEREAVEDFLRLLPAEVPPHAVVTGIAVTAGIPAVGEGFHIADSDTGQAHRVCVPPDLATCAACLAELRDPGDRRFGYPFINCTGCGPRATIIAGLPYDRVRTSMASFRMCAACEREYRDPGDRRFHAEPIACPDCGPALSWWDRSGGEAGGVDVLGEAAAVLAAGGIIGFKGIGGYQILGDARDWRVVRRVREVKNRPQKPLAVMVADLAAAHRVAHLGAAETALLTSAAAPIVLAAARPGVLPGELRPGVAAIGLMLPYSPAHHLLMGLLDGPVVCTSANVSGEPIIIDDAEAAERLRPLVDGVVSHDRPILIRCDDSVAHVVAGRPRTLRRARGYAPATDPLPVPCPQPLLAAGPQQKNTVTLAAGEHALTSPHVGDLATTATTAALTDAVEHLRRLAPSQPAAVAHDAHPGYESTRYALRLGPPATPVQHHHAHVAACAAEHHVPEPFIGVAFDGLGLGEDGTFWGGEVLLADYTGFIRAGRLSTAPMPGGEAAIRHPARMALGYLHAVEDLGSPRPDAAAMRDLRSRVGEHRADVIARLVTRDVHSPRTSSAGRLCEAVAALLGVCDVNTYEGEAACRLEALATGHDAVALPWRVVEHAGLHVYDTAVTLAAVCRAYLDGADPGEIAAGFHRALIAATVAMVEPVAARTGARDVCLGGGVFTNLLLAEGLLTALRERGLRAHLGERVPCGDGGISYGQAVVAAARMERW